MEAMHTKLRGLRTGDVPLFSLEGLTTKAKAVEVYDGDTFHAVFVLPGTEDMVVKMRCRLDGVDAPEIKPPLKTPDRDVVIKKAIAARQRLCELLTDGPVDAHQKLIDLTFKGFDKYGRALVDCGDISRMLIQEGLCKPYDGGKNSDFSGEHDTCKKSAQEIDKKEHLTLTKLLFSLCCEFLERRFFSHAQPNFFWNEKNKKPCTSSWSVHPWRCAIKKKSSTSWCRVAGNRKV